MEHYKPDIYNVGDEDGYDIPRCTKSRRTRKEILARMRRLYVRFQRRTFHTSLKRSLRSTSAQNERSLPRAARPRYLALHELGIGPGDEVIVPVITFIASVNPATYVGATPVFVDIDPSSWNMDPEKVEKAITKNTKAILPVHIYGNPCDMAAITEISERHGIPIIEDATESLGASVHGRKTGTFSSYGLLLLQWK